MTTKLVQTYADCNEIASARHLFDKMLQRNVFAWTALISFHSRSGMSHECLNAYICMKRDGVLPDKYVFPKVIRACAQPYLLKVGIQIHKEAISYGWESNVHVCNSLIDMSSKCGDILSARRVFDIMVERDLLSWNTMISGYVCIGFLALAVEFLRSMGSEGFEPDIVTWNTVMDASCRMGQCDEAWKIFGQIKEPNVISWTTLISGYSRTGKHDVTLGIFRDMMRRGDVFSDSDCLSSVLVSCRYLGELMCGRQVHAYGTKTETRLAFYKSAGPALLTMYARCRRTQEGRNVFSLMDKSDVVTWNAMIYERRGNEKLFENRLEAPCSIRCKTPSLQLKRKYMEAPNNNCKHLKRGHCLAPSTCPDDIPRSLSGSSGRPHGVANGPEVHDKRGLLCTRAPDELAAHVSLCYGTSVKVILLFVLIL
ncbi:hypothetical protein RJ639_001862 [Escallonia herrerae]|uniref:Pentatricopeptide repeat-containing protein n=1 Tax=Escallonia herrerae TaxID=1293975 RepID=A0AA88X973_9ASTE|nr:hypothetical protein RJ639_001862 [Escallonia herrerae]